MREFARFLSILLSIYNMLIIIRIILQWMRPMQPQMEKGSFSELLAKVVDPYLGLFRGLKFLRRGMLDFTPLAAFMVISILQRILQSIAYSGKLSVGYVLATIVQSLWWSIGSLFLGLFAVLVIIRIYIAYKPSPNAIQYINMLDGWLRGPMDMLHRTLYGGREVSDRVLLWTTLAVIAITYVLCTIAINLLVGFLVNLPF